MTRKQRHFKLKQLPMKLAVLVQVLGLSLPMILEQILGVRVKGSLLALLGPMLVLGPMYVVIPGLWIATYLRSHNRVAVRSTLLWLSASLIRMVERLLGTLFYLARYVLKWMRHEALLPFKTKSKPEDWVTSLGWFIPHKYRHVNGDILEDCAEMRELGYTERRIKFQVVYQWLIAVITLVPTAVKTSISDILKQVISPPK